MWSSDHAWQRQAKTRERWGGKFAVVIRVVSAAFDSVYSVSFLSFMCKKSFGSAEGDSNVCCLDSFPCYSVIFHSHCTFLNWKICEIALIIGGGENGCHDGGLYSWNMQ